MDVRFRSTLKSALLRSPMPDWIIRRRAARHVTTLAYHRIGPIPAVDNPFDDAVVSATAEELRRELRYFRQRFDVVSVEELAAGLDDRRLLPARPAIITFDDGYADNHEIAWPILRDEGVKACFFLCTALVGTRRLPWWDVVACCLKHARTRPLASPFGADDPPYLRADEAPAVASRRWLEHLKVLPWHVAEQHIERLVAESGVDAGDHLDRPLFMSWEAARELAADGMEIGAHTRTHPILGQIEDPAVLRDEIAGSRADLARRFGVAPMAFAYPVGSEIAMSAQADEAIREAGFRISFSHRHGLALRGRRSPFRVPRINAEFGDSFGDFRIEMARAPSRGSVA